MLDYGYVQHLADHIDYALTGDLAYDKETIEWALRWKGAIESASPKQPKSFKRQTCAICGGALTTEMQLCKECQSL